MSKLFFFGGGGREMHGNVQCMSHTVRKRRMEAGRGQVVISAHVGWGGVDGGSV